MDARLRINEYDIYRESYETPSNVFSKILKSGTTVLPYDISTSTHTYDVTHI